MLIATVQAPESEQMERRCLHIHRWEWNKKPPISQEFYLYIHVTPYGMNLIFLYDHKEKAIKNLLQALNRCARHLRTDFGRMLALWKKKLAQQGLEAFFAMNQWKKYGQSSRKPNLCLIRKPNFTRVSEPHRQILLKCPSNIYVN